MNSIETLKREIERALTGVETRLRKPRKETGNWWLDAKYNGHAVAVEWSAHRGFGISTNGPDDGYGEGPDEVFSEKDSASKRVIDLLVSGVRAVPPSDVVLRELRAAVGFTQEQLASRLGVQQAAISRLERRSDITLSSLRRYVEALGGELEINVRTPDGGQLKLLDRGKKGIARAACEHVHETLTKSGDFVCEPNVALLSNMVSSLERAARMRWQLAWKSDVSLRANSGVDLANASLDEGTISINTNTLARLATLCAAVASRTALAAPLQESVYRYVLGHELGHFVFVDPFAGDGAVACNDVELKADAVAGWLVGLVGDDPVAGSLASSLLGCRSPGCSHPSPEQRTFAFLSGHSRGSRLCVQSAAKMNLFVLRVEDLEVSRTFYAGLGLDLFPEKHGDGPLHYSCNLRDTVMELYPCSRSHPRPTPLRFGFSATRETFGRLRSSGLLPVPPRLIRQTNEAEIYLLKDPDQNAIELEIAA